MSKEQHIAIVTGANRGLGLGTAADLAQRGYRVILTARDEAAGRQAMAQLTGDVHFHPLDVTSDGSIEALRAYVEQEFGAADVLVNAVCPGWVRTDMGGPNATRTLGTGVASIVWGVTLPKGGPTGGFFCDGNRVAR